MEVYLRDVKRAHRLIDNNLLLSAVFYLGLAYFVFYELLAVALDFSILTGIIVLNLMLFFLFKGAYSLLLWVRKGKKIDFSNLNFSSTGKIFHYFLP